MGELFVGRSTVEDTARALYGDEPESHAHRLVLYDRIKRHRADQLRSAFPHCAMTLGDKWTALAFDYFVAFPWGSFDFQPRGERLPAFMTEAGLDTWSCELAAFEWGLYVARRGSAAPGPGARLAATTSVFRFEHDIVDWFERRHGDETAVVERRRTAVVTFRSATGAAGHKRIDDVEASILTLLRDGTGDFDPAQVPAPLALTAFVLEMMLERGLVVGVEPIIAEHRDLATDPSQLFTVGADLARVFELASQTQVRWEDGELQIWSPEVDEVVATADPRPVVVAHQFAKPCSLVDAIRASSEHGLLPCEVVEITDALVASGLVTRRG